MLLISRCCNRNQLKAWNKQMRCSTLLILLIGCLLDGSASIPFCNLSKITERTSLGDRTLLPFYLVLQSLTLPRKGKGKKGKKRSYYNTGYSYLVTNLSANRTPLNSELCDFL